METRPFRHLLVPLDFMPRNGRAVAIAGKLAAEAGAKITLLHVVERIAGAPDELRSFHRRLVAEARRKMRRFAAKLEMAGADVRERVVLGSRVQEILRSAEKARADLIVLSSHSVDLLKPGSGCGTISYKVGLLSRCPVLLVK